MVNAYLLINFAIIALPLLLSFDRRVVFFRQWRAVFPAIFIIGGFYIFEDILATSRGNWSFAAEWTGTTVLLGLPLGEWLFFLTVPYACIFIYACVRSYIPEKTVGFPGYLPWILSVASAIGALLFRDQAYTVVVLSVFSITSLLLALLRPDLLRSRHFWIALGLSYGAFLVVNGILTGVPVVLYNPDAIWGIRIITIPLEDFFYNFCLLTLNFLVFRVILDGFGTTAGRRGGWRTAAPVPGEYAGPGGLGSVRKPGRPYRFMENRNGH